MILLWGIPSESPLELVHAALVARRAPILIFNQRYMLTSRCDWRIDHGLGSGWLDIAGTRVPLEDLDGIYIRAMDPKFVPELRAAPLEQQSIAQAAHEALCTWCEVTPARVVNRLAAMGSNSSKPYQIQLLAPYGFRVPETLVTNDAAAVRAFVAQHGAIVYKSLSGARSIVRRFGADDETRLHRLSACPVQFQRYVAGLNVRVHVIGDRVFATAIESDAVDYRYAHREGIDAVLRPIDLDDDVAERCVQAVAGLGLAFAGLDLCVTDDDEWYCFEANPSPAFTYFETATGQPIADAVAAYLLGDRV
jgi:predicted ATP-grasp superfamily ATP-dependent carboligase